ncbi:hypothetical protein FOL47_006006 [Perkinsus chesapeaki]|uniref:RING-type domain-containing protein n=1 Tax=Perkinsus chesapeaki TaxID=330153 RepID=A0A7J6LUI0_PERCH|nr:hypothetical protein FOL47_006006 [Perkinsus chesapeaki]
MFAAALPGEGLVARRPQIPLANPHPSSSATAGSDAAHPHKKENGKRKLIWLKSTKPDLIPSIPMTGLTKVMVSKNPPWNRKILCINLPIDLLVNFVIQKVPGNDEDEEGKKVDYESWAIRSETAKCSDFPSLVFADGRTITLGRSHTTWLEPNATIFFRGLHGAAEYADCGFRFVFEDAPTTRSEGCRILHTDQAHPDASVPSGSSNPTAGLTATGPSAAPSSTITAVPANSPGGSEPSTAPPSRSTGLGGATAPAGVDPEWLQAIMAAFENGEVEAKRRRLLAKGDVVDLVDLDDDDDDSPPAAKHQSFEGVDDEDDDEETTYEDLQCAICQLYMYNPISLWDCLHPYCSSCMSRWLKNHADCPQCRAPVISVRPNLSLDPRSEEEKKDADAADTLKTHRICVVTISIEFVANERRPCRPLVPEK